MNVVDDLRALAQVTAAHHAIRRDEANARATDLMIECERLDRCIAAVMPHTAAARRWKAARDHAKAKASVWCAIAEGESEAAWANLSLVRDTRRVMRHWMARAG